MSNIYKSGLTNVHTEDLGVIAQAQRRVEVNKCYSFTCARSSDYGVWKLNAPPPLKTCPDCGSEMYSKSVIESKYISLVQSKK